MKRSEGRSIAGDGTAPRRRGPIRWAPVLLALAVGSSIAAREAAAQAPGYPQVPRGTERAEYVADVLTHINKVLADWGVAWGADDLGELLDMYWEDAVLIPPDGSPRRGQDELRAYFDEVLPTTGSVEAFMLDFDASGGMAQVFGNYLLEVDGKEIRGPMLTVYSRRGKSWRIRSQVFLPPR